MGPEGLYSEGQQKQRYFFDFAEQVFGAGLHRQT